MNVFIIAAITANGFIARATDEISTSWTSKEDRKLFVELTKRAGVMVLGKTTFQTFGKALPGRRNIVYSRSPIDQEGVETTSEEPQKLIARLEREGCQEVAICGGATIYDMFMRAGLVDELYLTVEPVLFGGGIPLFRDIPDTKLQLIEQKQLNENVIMMHYEVTK